MHGVGNDKRYRQVMALAVGAALLAGTAGCAGGSTDADGKGEAASAAPGPSGTSSAAPSAAPSAVGTPGPGADRLKALLLAPGSKAGRYEVSEPILDEPMNELYDAAPVVCQPLTSLGKAGHTAQAYGTVRVPGSPLDIGTDILLRSYPGASAAQAALKSLGEAGKQCAGGYTEDRALAEAKVLRVEEVKAPSVGDEARAYRIVVQDVKDEKISLYRYLTLVRSGSVTLSFRSDVFDVKDFGGVPQEIVTAQWEKFSKGPAS
ncbi:hypothetical protein OOK31_25780 [Streptomyces sp. NBC_00249]|uniref:hypothetical protein n=1 Tax=Streptomyces sp. NBC_00249 TaxID=2975690 RepID=UPI002253A035|nr:hypothetical protein [Streptomyces sp. NBC_00249]MCX5197268.1 hypothetical protein [Streptomyces sp. NBC_00249]